MPTDLYKLICYYIFILFDTIIKRGGGGNRKIIIANRHDSNVVILECHINNLKYSK